MLFNRDGLNIFAGDTYKGSSAFLILGGPSFGELITGKSIINNVEMDNKDILNYPGFVNMAVNNSPKTFRPNLWTMVDDPGNFIKSIWLDPKITKFVPFDHAEKPIFDNEKWEMTDIMVGECPNVLFYRRNEHFDPSQYLNESTFNWGEHSDSKDALGNKGGRSVMLVAIKLLYYLGVRNIFLLGCDFKMDENTKYHFDQDRSTGSQKGNNSTYHILKSRFDALKPYFDQVGLNVYNCNPDSGLKTFPFMSFQDAVNIATKDIPNIYTERTSGLYDRKANEKNKKQETKQDNKQSIDLTKTEFSENEKTLTKQELDRLRKKLNDLKHAKEIYVKMPDRNIETLNKLEEQISIARKEFREYEIIKNKVWGIPK
jgi:hypothetical protein